MHIRSSRHLALLSLLALLLTLAATGGHATFGQTPQRPTAEASLHNPTFDNHRWYEFNDRYGHYLTGSWLPDDDVDAPLSSRQDWRLWFMDGWGIPEFDPSAEHADSVEAVVMRNYGETDNLLAGLYQIIYGTTPCLTYEFSMKAHARPGSGDSLIAIQVGIDRLGWHLPTDDPAVHESFPASTVWGTAKQPLWNYQTLSVQAEALAEQITVFTYAHADGGRSINIYFDTGSFSDVTPARIYDPSGYAQTSGIDGLDASVGGTSATISWNSTAAGISQVYYRAVAQPITTTTTLSHTIYLPLVASTGMWQASALDKSYTTAHAITLSGLESGRTYEYFVVTRGVENDACTDWVSEKKTFTVP